DVVVILRRNARAINAGAKPSGGHAVSPRVNVGLLLGQHASTLLLVEKDNCSFRKALALRRGSGRPSVSLAETRGIGHRFQFCIKPSVEEHEKPESGGFDGSSVAHPRIDLLVGRMIEPISCVRKSLTQSHQIRVARIFVAVETKVGKRLALPGGRG